MKARQREFDEVVGLMHRVVGRMAALDEQAHDFGTGDRLYRAEIHTVQAIGDLPGISVTGLAEHLGVTKGAVSQMLRKLCDKRLVSKEYAPGSQRERRLLLTQRGARARAGHEALHQRMVEIVRQRFGRHLKERMGMFRDVFTELDEILDRLEGEWQ